MRGGSHSSKICSAKRLASALRCALPALLALALVTGAKGQEPAAKLPPTSAAGRLIDEEPFDLLTLDAANENAVLKLQLLPFRKPPVDPKPMDKLRVKLLDDSRQFEVAYRNIVKFEFFEQMVIAELQQLTAAGKLDEAYEYLTFLRANYALADGLDGAHNAYLYQSTVAAFRNQHFAEALGLAEELRRRDPAYRATAAAPTLQQVLGATADKLIGEYIAKDDLISARTLLSRLTTTYSLDREPFAVKWRNDFAAEAARMRDNARALLERGEYIAAYDAFTAMKQRWPDVEGGSELAAEMARRYPMVRVGVLHSGRSTGAPSLADPAARRNERLLQRRLFEFVRMGPEGGEYVCPLARVQKSDDQLQLMFRLHHDDSLAANVELPTTAYDLSTLFINRSAAPLPWQLSIGSVQVKQVWQLDVRLQHPRVLPEALMQDLAPADFEPLRGPYTVLPGGGELVRFTANQHYKKGGAGRPAEISQQLFVDAQASLLALRRGEIDLLADVHPPDVTSLKQDSALVVAPLNSPTSHVVLIRSHNPHLANRTFRRALVYGSNREVVLRQAVLRGVDLPGCRTISAPFPAPAGRDDSVAYGYDERTLPRPYDPRLALTLRMLGQREVKAQFEKRSETEPPLRKLTFAHASDEIALSACRALAQQWKMIGIECELVALPPGESVDVDGKADLVYACLQTWEPLVDAGQLFGDDGLAATDNSFIKLALRQLASAENWRQARQSLQELHRLVHEDVTLIPLWQTYDHIAYRKSLQGVGESPATVFQNIEQWRIVTDQVAKSN